MENSQPIKDQKPVIPILWEKYDRIFDKRHSALDAYTVIVENDESQWKDQAGKLYHYPQRYAKFLLPGTKLVYYKRKQKDTKYAAARLSQEPHYFAFAVADELCIEACR